ncbi:MAG: hypothetical protein JXR86_03535 [Spirochaetales bacterium]|nr:hypothetical protein [Spirochaetales bacterium]
MRKKKRGFDLRRKIAAVFISSITILAIVAISLLLVFVSTKEKFEYYLDTIIGRKIELRELDQNTTEVQNSIFTFVFDLDYTLSSNIRDQISLMIENVDNLYDYDEKISIRNRNREYLAEAKEKRMEMLELIRSFNKSITGLLDLYVEKGLTEDIGIRGRFRSSARDFEKFVDSTGNAEFMAEYLTARRYEKDYIIRGTDTYIDLLQVQVRKMESRVRSLNSGSDEQETLLKTLNSYRTGFLVLVDIDDSINRALEDLHKINNSINPFIEKELSAMDLFLADEMDGLSRAINSTIRNIVILGIIILASNLIGALVIIRSVKNPMDIILSDTARLEKGDLSRLISYGKKDEMGSVASHINSAVSAFRNLISQAQHVSEQSVELTSSIVATASETASATREINANISSIDRKTELLLQQVSISNKAAEDIKGVIGSFNDSVQHQSASVEESSTAIEQMAMTIQNVAVIAKERRDAAQVLQTATECGEQQIINTNRLITEVSQIARDILNITKIINGIASQTNLLAMNAAIEAAHAGDVGRGFAVVADEIRKLAESSSVNAKQISTLLKEAGTRIASASDASAQSTSAFMDVKGEVGTFVRSLSEIAESMSEMSTGSQEILRSTGLLKLSMSELKKETIDINGEVDNISSSMVSVSSLTGETSNGISEIRLAISDIDKSIINLNEKCHDNEKLMEKMDGSLKEFIL